MTYNGTEEYRKANDKVKKETFSGFVTTYDITETTIVDSWEYKNGKPKQRIGAVLQGKNASYKNARTACLNAVYYDVWTEIDYAEYSSLQWGEQNCGSGGCGIETTTDGGRYWKVTHNVEYLPCNNSTEGGLGETGDPNTSPYDPSMFDGSSGGTSSVPTQSFNQWFLNNFHSFDTEEEFNQIASFVTDFETLSIYNDNFDPNAALNNPDAYRIIFEAAWLKAVHPNWSDAHCLVAAYKNVLLNDLHYVLDIVGLIPGAGEFVDLLNGGVYLLEGNPTDASISFAGMLPIGGQLATIGKWGRNALKFDSSVQGFISKSGIVFTFGSVHGNRISHVLAHGVNDLSKPTQGVFNGSGKDIISVVDEAWEKKLNQNISASAGNNVFEIDMGRNIGWEGGSQGTGVALTKIRIIMASGGSSQIISAYPIR